VDPKVCREHLSRLVTEEISALSRLEVVLDSEHEYLVANDIEQLASVAETRQDCISSLLRVEDERRSLCRTMKLPTDPTGIERLLAWCDPSRALHRRWADCMQLATSCRTRNDRNGALVSARLKRVEGVFDVLTGRANQPKVYGKGGGYDNPARGAQVLATA